MKLIVLGAPGVGKGTYTQALVKEMNIPQISTGDIFRENIKNKTALGQQVEHVISSGKLVADEIVIGVVKDRLIKPDCEDGFVLDGFPRNLFQAQALENITPVDLVIYFRADPEVVVQRISGRITCKSCKKIYHKINLPPKVEGVCDVCGGEIFQRPDDVPETVRKRLITYEQVTAPLINYYAKKQILKEVVINEDFGSYKELIMTRIFKAINEH